MRNGKNKTESKSGKEMNETSDAVRAAQKARTRALIVPREHGAWGLLLVPLFTGVAAGFAPEHRIWPLLMFTVAALSLFWLRTPVESLIGTGPLAASTGRERRMALITSISLAALATACLAGLMWKGHNLQLLLLGGATALAFLVQSVLRRLGRKTRMVSQLVGAIGLVCTAPAAYYIGTGRLSERAFVLWVANWIFAGNQIHFVQLPEFILLVQRLSLRKLRAGNSSYWRSRYCLRPWSSQFSGACCLPWRSSLSSPLSFEGLCGSSLSRNLWMLEVWGGPK
jgi:hypothetical protein